MRTCDRRLYVVRSVFLRFCLRVCTECDEDCAECLQISCRPCLRPVERMKHRRPRTSRNVQLVVWMPPNLVCRLRWWILTTPERRAATYATENNGLVNKPQRVLTHTVIAQQLQSVHGLNFWIQSLRYTRYTAFASRGVLCTSAALLSHNTVQRVTDIQLDVRTILRAAFKQARDKNEFQTSSSRV